MNRLLDLLATLIQAMWPAIRRQDIPDTATANGPQALPAVEQLATASPAPATVTKSGPTRATVTGQIMATVTKSGPTRATVPGQIRRASTPEPSSQPRGPAAGRSPPGPATESNPDPRHRAPGSRFVGTGQDRSGVGNSIRLIPADSGRSPAHQIWICRDGTGRVGKYWAVRPADYSSHHQHHTPGETMSTTADSRLSEQEALAVTKALMEARDSDAFLMITGSEDLRTLVLAACTMAAAVLKHGGIDGARYLEWRQQNLAAEN